ncbi:hypothetical protein MKW98_006474 [Papaver atlanticum]|uniref:Uncharacterized protein n=1 Tax=Papaver atlanticum TaxID=357466 RepID=A0AAD4SH28_9MAGN|nr:hypothetical protein MKW98_006474 [Papaver atlanticum]
MKGEYEEFKIRINALVAMAEKVTEDGWTMQDGTPWPGNNVPDHPGVIQVFLGHNGVGDAEGDTLPRLVYISREKRSGFDHHKKAEAMNSLVRVSAVISNAPYLLNVHCDHHINNSKALREAMCFMMDPTSGKKICYVQFPQDLMELIDMTDTQITMLFFDINMNGLHGIQGPISVVTGCVFRRQALYQRSHLENHVTVCQNAENQTDGEQKENKTQGTSKQIHALESIEEGMDGL